MGLSKAVLDIAKHAREMAERYDDIIAAELEGIDVALRAAVTAADEPIPVGVPVDIAELEQLRAEVERLKLFERAVTAVSGRFRTPEECALKMLQDAESEAAQ